MKKAKRIIFILATTTSFFMVWPFCAFANIKSLSHFIFKGNTVYSSKMLNHICSKGASWSVRER